MSALQILEFQMINVTKHCQIVYGRLNTAQMNQTRIVLLDTSNAIDTIVLDTRYTP